MSPLPGSSVRPLWKEMPVSRAFFWITFVVPSKGVLLPGSPHRAPTEIDPHFQSPPSSISQSPWYMSPLSGSSVGPLWREIPVSRAFLYITFRVLSKGAPPSGFSLRPPTERDAPLPELSFIRQSPWYVRPLPGSSVRPVWGKRCLWGLYRERYLFPELSSTHPLIIYLYLKSQIPGKGAPPHLAQQGPFGERCCVSRANGLFIHLYLSESPVKELSHEIGENIRSPSMDSHLGRTLTYNGVWPGSPWGSFMTLLSLPQCHAAFSTIPSTLLG
jgi:hypothetical protein